MELDLDDIFLIAILIYRIFCRSVKLYDFAIDFPNKLQAVRVVDRDCAVIWSKLATLTETLGSSYNMHL